MTQHFNSSLEIRVVKALKSFGAMQLGDQRNPRDMPPSAISHRLSNCRLPLAIALCCEQAITRAMDEAEGKENRTAANGSRRNSDHLPRMCIAVAIGSTRCVFFFKRVFVERLLRNPFSALIVLVLVRNIATGTGTGTGGAGTCAYRGAIINLRGLV